MFKLSRRKKKDDIIQDGQGEWEIPVVSLDRSTRRWPHATRISLIVLLTIAALIAAALLAAYLFVTKLPLKGEPQGRVNILVMGIDEAADLSDTLMLISVDTRTGEELKTAIVSIPRDLWVDIPGYGANKINTAYSTAEQTDFPGGGARLTAKTIESVFDQPIHYYFAMNFDGFKKAINAVGGVEVNVREDIDDSLYPDGRGGHEPYSISAGTHRLGGEAALKYTRSRFSTSDFDRAARQQQVLLGFKDRLLDRNIALDGEARDKLSNVYRQHIDTDMSIRELLKLGNILRELPPEQYIRHVLSNQPESFLEDADFAGYVLVPRSGTFEQISQMIDEIFDNPPPTSGETR